ncbi:13395_t:CDS:10 [Acaulospora morrowiae]|uniref:13395_t:CDS:1 n=1 Tax=Acaulospora morrowiae TaxID=94023 RepID=A0A9N8VHK1_9GLOM|nr:13395_t:CDS:10 [Acaulospora morrowiae]
MTLLGKTFNISGNRGTNISRTRQFVRNVSFVEVRPKIVLVCPKTSIARTSTIMKSCYLPRTLPSIISRHKSKFTITMDNLPTYSKKPSEFDAIKKGPEWESTIGKIVRESQAKYPHCVVLTRVGQFWELYFEQAREIAPLLDIKLTKKKFGQEYFPFAGFPLQHLDRYLTKLINEHGRAVAICDEFPNTDIEKRVKFTRLVTRIITPGTLIDESFLPQDQNNFLLSVSLEEDSNRTGLAWVDITTGQFYMQESLLESLSNDLSRIRPSEVVLSDTLKLLEDHPIWQHVDRGMKSVAFESWHSFDATQPQAWMSDHQDDVEIREVFTVSELKASAALLNYVERNLIGRVPKMQFPIRMNPKDIMIIDGAALRSLEITTSMRDLTKKGSLMHAIQRTKTASGTRALYNWLRFPSTSIDVINNRLDLVEYFHDNTHLTSDIIQMLGECDDAQRTSQKVTFNHCSPDDFLKLRRTLEVMLTIKNRLFAELYVSPSESVGALLDRLKPQQDLISIITAAVDEEALNRAKEKQSIDGIMTPDGAIDLEEEDLLNLTRYDVENDKKKVKTSKRNGTNAKDVDAEIQSLLKNDNWVILKDFSPQLKTLHKELESAYREMINLQIKWQTKLNGPLLELRSHPSYGFIVIAKKIRGVDVEGILKAVQINHFKSKKIFIVKKWTELGGQIEDIKVKIREEENNVFQLIREKVVDPQSSRLFIASHFNLLKVEDEWHVTVCNSKVMDELDIATSLAVLAREQKMVRPILNNSYSHKIEGGRHPIVESSLQLKGQKFVKNNCYCGEKERLLLITGPNMGGKSTYLRQNAIISILAQIGSFVPADYAEIGIVDQILSRVGASDNLYKNQSTFMVEMIETAHILKNATQRSFVIMDEIGRGTTTLDGIAISFATLFQLHYMNRCRTLFATHFHELPNLIKDFEHASCYCTDIQENEDGSFYYLHELRRGVNCNSAALRAAQLAGMPSSVLIVARSALECLKKYSNPINLHTDFQEEVENIMHRDFIKAKERRTVEVIAKGMAGCSVQATTYAKCITNHLENINKDLCAKEFDAFKKCLQKAIGKSW